ncbi:MAG TPA: ECF-type sigma factor [Candidatus Acidoferrales bacterium]|nr:ECF-type sigma factor [Candidatus Acidoferrales bacterium]
MASSPEITRHLQRWQNGDPAALEALLPLLYDEMRELAASYLRRERAGHTLQPTALAHEAFLRISSMEGVTLQSRSQFLGIVANVMRRVLADHARRRRAAKRGGGALRVPLEVLETEGARDVGADDLDTALEDLARVDARQARVVELRFYGGLSIEEVGELLGVSPATVKRDWMVARAWLHRELSGDAA